jgi:prepilin-type N-terminal cleavage/methylation domain-containing protein
MNTITKAISYKLQAVRSRGFTRLLKGGMMPRRSSDVPHKSILHANVENVPASSRWHKTTVPPNSAGFTLIEMMVAVSIFSIVMLIATGSMLSIIDANRKAQSVKAVVNNLNFTVENISRNLRVGTRFRCMAWDNISADTDIQTAQDCPSGNTALAHEHQFGNTSTGADQYVYIFVPYNASDPTTGAVYRQKGGGAGNGTRTRLTAPNVVVEQMTFYVNGAASRVDATQPRVRMVMKGYTLIGDIRSEFNLQTSVTQRVLNI